MVDVIDTNEQQQQQSSVEFQTSTKGYVTYKVKVYSENPDEAFEKAIELSNKARGYTSTYNG